MENRFYDLFDLFSAERTIRAAVRHCVQDLLIRLHAGFGIKFCEALRTPFQSIDRIFIVIVLIG